MKPTSREIRAEAVLRVNARHRGFVPPPKGVLTAEYDREELHVRSLAAVFPWEQVVSTPVASLPLDADVKAAA
ncbi:MAG TPA: hypothetical protein VIJ66_02315 [Solirubrobacteraceae bacterium]